MEEFKTRPAADAVEQALQEQPEVKIPEKITPPYRRVRLVLRRNHDGSPSEEGNEVDRLIAAFEIHKSRGGKCYDFVLNSNREEFCYNIYVKMTKDEQVSIDAYWSSMTMDEKLEFLQKENALESIIPAIDV